MADQQNGFIVADNLMEDWELLPVDSGDLYESRQEALDWIDREIHPWYRRFYAVRELRSGKIVKEN